MERKAQTTNHKRLSQRFGGQIKRLFKSDYHLLRVAGLTRQQAMTICISRYSEL
jgi:hypothetical protein